MNLGTALVALRADNKALKKDLELAKQQTVKATSAMQRNATSAEAAFRKMWVAIGGAGLAIMAVRTFQQAIKAASDLQEVTNKFNVVFRGQQDIAEGWAKTLVASYSMSTREAKQFLASIQDLLVPMGMAAKEAGKLSFEIVKLATDLGSFNNLPTAQVMLDIQSALVGNFETMKKYGVVLNAANVKQEALNMGLVTNVKELNAAQKAQAAYSLIVKGSQAAIGDNARSVGSYAKTLKDATAAWEDFMAELGKTILPAATIVLKWVSDWLKDFLYVLQELKKMRNEIQGTKPPGRHMIREPIPGAGPGGVGGGGAADNPAVKAAVEANEAIALADAEAKENLRQAQIDHDAAMAEFRKGVTERNLAAFQEEAERTLEIETSKASALREIQGWEDEDFWTRMQDKYDRLEDYRRRDLISEEQYQKSLATLNRQTAMGILGQWTQMFYNYAQIAGKHQKTMFRLYQAGAIAQATIAGAEAAVHAWDWGMRMGGPYLAAAFAAGSIAYTGSVIAAIASQSLPSQPSVTTTSPAGPGGLQTVPGAEPEEREERGQVTINIEGDILADEYYIEMLAEKISEAVEGNEVRLIATETRAT